jgi:hypothetical protein
MIEDSLTQVDAVKEATIKVENINGPVQLISAANDEIWPSTRMSIDIQNKLLANDFPHVVDHLTVNSEHMFSQKWAPILEKRISDFFVLHLTNSEGTE